VASRLPSETFVRPVTSKSVVDEVTDEIARSIRSGALRPGQEFSLREIAGQLGVSFIPVREALRRLEGQGLLVTRRNRSAIVAPLDAADLHAIYRLRRQIEPDLAAASCRVLTEADYDRLEAFAELFADESLGIDDIYDAHHDFHTELLRRNGTSGWPSAGSIPTRPSTAGGRPSTPTSSTPSGSATPGRSAAPSCITLMTTSRSPSRPFRGTEP